MVKLSVLLYGNGCFIGNWNTHIFHISLVIWKTIICNARVSSQAVSAALVSHILLCFYQQWANGGFEIFTVCLDDDLMRFRGENESENTWKETLYDLSIFQYHHFVHINKKNNVCPYNEKTLHDGSKIYCFYPSKIRFISSRHHVKSSIYDTSI